MDFSYKQARATNEETVIAKRGSFLAGLNAIGRVRVCRTASLCVAFATMALLVATPCWALDKVSLQLKWLHQFQFAGYYTGLEQGFYRDAGPAAIVNNVDLIDLGEHRLRDLSQPQRIYQVRAEALRGEFPPLKYLNSTVGNLPGSTTSFLGRENDLAEVKALLRTLRVLTLTE